ncbi:MAG: hypothetical protein QME47_06600, partial [Candidatus Thermoplasmatota archaeon]|nr:hypothetical protein [Candidatus Thermoplasmatota archaeon]
KLAQPIKIEFGKEGAKVTYLDWTADELTVGENDTVEEITVEYEEEVTEVIPIELLNRTESTTAADVESLPEELPPGFTTEIFENATQYNYTLDKEAPEKLSCEMYEEDRTVNTVSVNSSQISKETLNNAEQQLINEITNNQTLAGELSSDVENTTLVIADANATVEENNNNTTAWGRWRRYARHAWRSTTRTVRHTARTIHRGARSAWRSTSSASRTAYYRSSRTMSRGWNYAKNFYHKASRWSSSSYTNFGRYTRAVKYMRTAGKVAGYAGHALTAYTIGSHLYQRDYRGAAREGVSAAGGFAGGLACAKVGALIGAAGGPVGAAAGAVVGGIVGGFAGGWIAGKLSHRFGLSETLPMVKYIPYNTIFARPYDAIGI